MATTEENFESNIIEIAECLVSAFGLTYCKNESTEDHLALHRWMDYRLRYIPNQCRKVEKSFKFPVKNLPSDIIKALDIIESMCKSGKDINPYLSKTTVLNDVGSENIKHRTDGLWADWRIHHLHLTNTPLGSSDRFSKRSNWLLFFMVYEDVVAFIDVREHNERDVWTQVDLIRTFIQSWPEQAAPYRVNRVVVDTSQTTAEQNKLLRNAGINTTVECDGQHYFGLGRGITAANTSIAGTMRGDTIMNNARQIAKWLDISENPIRIKLKELSITHPIFNLGICDSGVSIACHEVPEIAWTLPDYDQNGNRSAFGALREGLLPSWALPKLISFLKSK